MRIAAVGDAFPEHYYAQDQLIDAFKKHWAKRHFNVGRLESLHKNVLVGGRHLALPIEAYEELDSFTEANDAYIRCAVDLGTCAIEKALGEAALKPRDVDHLFFVSTTGVATPSIDARLLNRLAFRRDVRRTPIFGLGCAAGAAGIVRASDYLRGYPDQVALLLSVELCSLTLQREDLSIPNIIASGLFGDGAAAVVLTGGELDGEGPQIIATRSVFYPDTERVMGWDVTAAGLKVVLSAEIPEIVRENVRGDVECFLGDCGVPRKASVRYICHPGGPKVLEAFEEALSLPENALEASWRTLEREGNLSSASVLLVLRDTLRAPPPQGAFGLLMALGPGFCAELVLLRW